MTRAATYQARHVHAMKDISKVNEQVRNIKNPIIQSGDRMKYDTRTDVLAHSYDHRGNLYQLTKFSEVQYHEIHSIASPIPSYAMAQDRVKYVIGIAFRDGDFVDDCFVELYPGKKSSNEPWRKNIFHVYLERNSIIGKGVRNLLTDYRVYFEDDHVDIMTAWIDDRVEHEVKEYKKWCKEQNDNRMA
jgi:hypothetical protein